MHVDKHFIIGSTHDVCQDYVLVTDEGPAVVVVSDGCSSSKLSDIGARLLCSRVLHDVRIDAANKRYAEGLSFSSILVHSLEYVKHAASVIKAPDECFDATLLVLTENVRKKAIDAHVVGDGIIAARRRGSDVIETWIYDVLGYPNYGSYLIFPDRLRSYIELGLHVNVTHYLDKEVVASSKRSLRSERDWVQSLSFSYRDYDIVAAITDGAASIVDKNANKQVSVIDTIHQLMAFKSLPGEFVKRRLNKFSKEMVRSSLTNTDDIGLGAVELLDAYEEKDEGLCQG